MDATQIRRILSPTDFGEVSTLALQHAVRLAERTGAELTVLYADPFLPPLEFTGRGAAAVARSLEEEQKAAEEYLRRHVAEHVPAAVPAEAVVAVGYPAEAILTQAEARRADVIVMGTHGRSGIGRLTMGSVTERVLNEARVPVLAVRVTGEGAAPGAEVRRILLPTNFTHADRAALEQAAGLGRLLGAELVVAHIAPTAEEVTGLRDEVCAWVPQEAQEHCSLRHAVRSGDAAEQVLALAAEEHVDLVVVAGQKRRLLDLQVFGSTTERIIRHAPAPVWVVPHA